MKKYQPTLYLLTALIGVLIGVYISKKESIEKVFYSYNKVDELMHLVHGNYVDSISMEDIIEKTMPKVLTELDPHSTYIPAKDLEATNADLKSSFSGIGIRFIIQDDTIHINEVIRKGPSEKVGLLPGDRIVTVDDTLLKVTGCPIRKPPDQSLLTAPRSLSQSSASFIACRCQGIHRAPVYA